MVKVWLGGGTSISPGFMAAGSGTATPSEDDTAISKVMSLRATDSINYSGEKMVEYEMVLPSTVPAGSTFLFTEVGLMSGSPTGSLFTHSTFAGVNKTQDVEVQTIIGVRIG